MKIHRKIKVNYILRLMSIYSEKKKTKRNNFFWQYEIYPTTTSFTVSFVTYHWIRETRAHSVTHVRVNLLLVEASRESATVRKLKMRVKFAPDKLYAIQPYSIDRPTYYTRLSLVFSYPLSEPRSIGFHLFGDTQLRARISTLTSTANTRCNLTLGRRLIGNP